MKSGGGANGGLIAPSDGMRDGAGAGGGGYDAGAGGAGGATGAGGTASPRDIAM